jgi:glyoxylase-like metal-dependent hydrolase (beta-lactamase superfamily II)
MLYKNPDARQMGHAMIRTITDSHFLLDGGSMNGIVPRVLWVKAHPPDERGRITLASRVTLLEEKASGRIWLVDAGMGNGWSGKLADIYGIEKVEGGLAEQLAGRGVSPEDITDLVLTHLHFDHSAGAVARENGRMRSAFPNAKIYVQKKQMQWALSPSVKDAGSYRKEDVEFIAASKHLVLVEGPERLSDSVSVRPVYGHTEGMQTVSLERDEKTFVVASDLIPMFSHVNIPWVMAFDNHPLVTIEEKRTFLEEAVKRDWTVISGHDAHAPAARIRKTGEDKFEYTPVDL